MWIDSLCILQDSADDWAKQASEMAMIYDNAYITLCAFGARDGATGLFVDRTSVHTIAGTHESMPYTVYVRQMLCHGAFEVKVVDEDVSSIATKRGYRQRNLPGFKRGWISQEQLLSRRVVHFTEEELVWDCREAITCECNSITEHTAGALSFKQFVLMGLHDINRARSSWTTMMRDFVARDFTEDSDRLPALSGLAQRFQDSTGANFGSYCAGLWISELPLGLMWLTRHPGERSSQSNNVGFVSSPPSWSWAALKPMALYWPEWLTLCHSEVNVLDAETYPSTSDPKGMVSGGHLLLEGRLLQLWVSWSDAEPCEGKSPCLSGHRHYQFALTKDDGEPQDVISSGQQSHAQINPDVDLADDGLTNGQSVTFLPVAYPPKLGHITTDAPYGLFLVETETVISSSTADPAIEHRGQRIKPVFKRVGQGKVCSYQGSLALSRSSRKTLLLM